MTLASAFQDHQYNVLLIDFSAQGTSGGRSSLGFREISELRAAMNAVADRGDVDAGHFGVWGVNVRAYVALLRQAPIPECAQSLRNLRIINQKTWSACWSTAWALGRSLWFWNGENGIRLDESVLPERAAFEDAPAKFHWSRAAISGFHLKMRL